MDAPPCILVVDDDVDIRETLVDVLEDNGCTAVSAGNGAIAMKKLQGEAEAPRPCLIFLDLMMPVMDGRAFRAAQLRSEGLASIPVVVISAYPSVAQDAEAMKAAGYLRKPLKLADVIRTAKQFCSCPTAA